ncbi:MAG: arginine decarboxylase, partial [Gammaproteobacteria bacterium]|nr:arginine decarboxylase [Gammaproteobacteria bacterium]
MATWNIQQSKSLYNIQHWGDGYFDINERGNICVQLGDKQSSPVDLYQVSQEIKKQGLNLPVLVRVTNILSDRLEKLYSAFSNAINVQNYQGKYIPVYPIKVNQQRTVLEHLLAGNQERMGLEAGSKPELMVVLSHANEKSGVIVCNGYKDREYIRLALIGQKLGHQVFIVIEKLSEVNLILEEAKNLDVEPMMGLRVRLASIGKGNWQNTGGEKSKFGLSADQVLQIVNQLQQQNALQY